MKHPKYLLVIPLIIFSQIVSQDCDEGYTEYDGECYFDDDLNTLSMLIYLNDIEFELFYDIGITIWQNSRINTLMLEGLSIHEIPNNIQNLDSLVFLSFSDNILENIPSAIGSLPSLKNLFLSNNQLVEIPETIGNLNNLEFLHLSGNQLINLPSTISNLPNLISLNVDNNLLTSFSSSILELSSLQYLYIANNGIIELPVNLEELSTLQIISAYSNNIVELPTSIGELSYLYHFDFTNNEITTIPESICDIYENLTVFNIGINYICPPYPDCFNDVDIGEQNTSECIELELGDLNEDGNIDILDIVMIIEIIIENINPTEYHLWAADLNSDGLVDILDIIIIVGIILDS